MDNRPDNEKEQEYLEPGSQFKKKWENYWYHYKTHTIIAVFAIVTVVIMSVQFFTKDKFDYYLLYAGPQIIAVQDLHYIQRSFSEFADDYNGDGEVSVALNDIVMLSPEEMEAAMDDGAVFNGNYQQQMMTEYYQQIVAGDVVICLLSPYMYEIVNQESGFMPLSEIFGDDIPDSAYDECGIVLSKTDFGQEYNGVNNLPDDTILCIRRISTLKNFKGADKTEKHHAAYVELFRKIVTYESAEDSTDSTESTD